jgi:hypothetical protein
MDRDSTFGNVQKMRVRVVAFGCGLFGYLWIKHLRSQNPETGRLRPAIPKSLNA